MKTMRKLSFVFMAILLLSLSACAAKCNRTASGDTGTVKAADTSSNDQEVSDMTDIANKPKILVTYFSCTGNTRSVATLIANALKADIHEIQPEAPYTSADLNWRNNASRSSRENSDPASRPAISGKIENMEQYGIIFLGYPIWWGQAPRIILTFLERYDFSGKTIVPFCTAATSGVGSSATNLHRFCSDNTTWLSGFRLAINSTHSDIVTWINGLELEITLE